MGMVAGVAIAVSASDRHVGGDLEEREVSDLEGCVLTCAGPDDRLPPLVRPYFLRLPDFTNLLTEIIKTYQEACATEILHTGRAKPQENCTPS